MSKEAVSKVPHATPPTYNAAAQPSYFQAASWEPAGQQFVVHSVPHVAEGETVLWPYENDQTQFTWAPANPVVAAVAADDVKLEAGAESTSHSFSYSTL
ncbi:hypothetical protein AAVH_12733 [Aphelenchoides avenae]|nr:hypothetical protein AAVH_12733 [Aphelenchus avenae]